MPIRRRYFWALIAVLLAVAAVIKAPTTTGGAPNLEATYHVLLTTSALEESPISRHHLLPTVTLGGANDRFVPWAAALPMRSGHFVYTSFSSVGFLPPLAFFEITGLPHSRAALFGFVLLLQVAVVTALGVLLLELLRVAGQTADAARRGALLGVAVQILSAEALLDYGAVYWSQQFYQLVLCLSLLCLLKILERDARHCAGWLAGLCALCFVGAWVEWSGFAFAGGAFLVLAGSELTHRQYRWPAFLVGLAGVCGIAAMIVHYASYVGLHDLLMDFFRSARSRSAARGSPIGLLQGYAWSFGLFVPIAGAAAWIAWRGRGTLPPSGARIALLVFLAALFPMVENLLLIQHAVQFSFDRMKLAVPLAMLIALGVAMLPGRKAPWIAAACVLLACGQNLLIFQAMLQPYRAWAAIDRGNHMLAQAAASRVRLPCAVIAGTRIRGYDNLLFHRAIHELVTPEGFRVMAATPQARRCGAIYLEGIEAFPDLWQYRRMTVSRDGTTTRLALTPPSS